MEERDSAERDVASDLRDIDTGFGAWAGSEVDAEAYVEGVRPDHRLAADAG
nr:hypothetical protein [Actinomycetales bacterium]